MRPTTQELIRMAKTKRYTKMRFDEIRYEAIITGPNGSRSIDVFAHGYEEAKERIEAQLDDGESIWNHSLHIRTR